MRIVDTFRQTIAPYCKHCKMIHILSFLLVACLLLFWSDVSYLYDSINVSANIEKESTQITRIAQSGQSEHAAWSEQTTGPAKTTSSSDTDLFRSLWAKLERQITNQRKNFTLPQRAGWMNALPPQQQSVLLASWYWLVDDWEKIVTNPAYASIVVTRVEAIELLVALKTQFTTHTFNDTTYIDKELIFPDMKRDGWYVPYVLYAFEKWWLEWYLEPWDSLDPYGIMTYEEMTALFTKFWWNRIDPDVRYASQQVTKEDFIHYMVESFDKRFADARIMWWNNTLLYKNLLAALKNKPLETQQALIDKTLQTFTIYDPDDLLQDHGYDIWWVRLLLEKLL